MELDFIIAYAILALENVRDREAFYRDVWPTYKHPRPFDEETLRRLAKFRGESSNEDIH